MTHRLLFLSAAFSAVLAGVGLADSPPKGSPLSVDQARAIVAPLYEALNEPSKKDVESLLTRSTSPDFKSCGGEDNCVDRDAAIKGFKTLGAIVPDLHWAIHDVLVAGDQIIVRGEASGTPTKPFLGVAPSGKTFKVMSIDIHSVRDNQVVRVYHLENWAAALRQLAAN
jgi:predicted ester cyclase